MRGENIMKKYNVNYRFFIYFAMLLPLFLFMFKKDTIDHVTAQNLDQTIESVATVDTNEKAEFATHEISHEEILRLTEGFMETLVQDINNDTYQVLNYHTKDELLKAFEFITTHDIAKQFIDAYYVEGESGLYIIPTSTPPWFEGENDYDVIQLNESKVNVTQFIESDFYGAYQIELEFTFEKEWKITDVVYP